MHSQAGEGKALYKHTIDLLKGMDIDTESEDNTKKEWKQLHMMIEGEDCQALHTLNNNVTITPEDQEVPIRVLDAIQTTINEEEHFWH